MAIDKAQFREVADLIATWKQTLLVTHMRPDGDAIGAVVALRRMLDDPGRHCIALLFDPIPERYSFLDPERRLGVFGKEITRRELEVVDGVLVLDTCTYNQVEPLASWLRECRAPKVAVDHHVTRDELADKYLIDESAAATCLMLVDWARAMGWRITPDIATALFVGVSTDTGWFRHSNTDSRVFESAAYLEGQGARSHEIFRRLYQQDSAARFCLRAAALSSLELRCDGRLAVTILRRPSFAECGASMSDTEDLVNEPMQIGSVVASIMFVEQEDGMVRIGFRSKPPLDGIWDVDVSAVARHFGGGGHVRASGARFAGTLEEAHRNLMEYFEQLFADFTRNARR